MSGTVKNIYNWATPMFFAIGVILLAFFIADLVIWGLVTGIVMFLFSAGVILVLQVLGAVSLWKNPWLILVSPALIFFGYAGQYYSVLTIAPAPQAQAAQLTLASGVSFTLYTVAAALIIGVIISLAIKKR